MDSGVFYLLTGPAHAARLVVSLWSLRRHYSGPVTVYTTHPDSHEIGDRCQFDSRLQVVHKVTDQVNLQRNSSFLTKLDLLFQIPYRVALYLDADTLVAGRLDSLLDTAQSSQFAATQFANWLAHGRTVRRRLEAWRTITHERFDPECLNTLVDQALQSGPAVNGGVFAFRRDAEILRPWRELSYAGCDTFICDEVALQLMLPRFPHKVLDCRFNCSPVYAKHTTDVRVWHFHGERHVGHPVCRELWWPAFRISLAENIAGLAEWAPDFDRRLAGALRHNRR